MGGIIGGGSNAKQQKAVGSLQFQTSQHGGVIPLVYGTTRVSPNLIDYDDFKATPSSRQGGGARGVAVVRGAVSNINTVPRLLWVCVKGRLLVSALYGGTRMSERSPLFRPRFISETMGRRRTHIGRRTIPPRL